MPHTLDALDRKILSLLQEDGRMSLADLAAKVGLSPSPCLRRVRMLERAGVIARAWVPFWGRRVATLMPPPFCSPQARPQCA